MSGQVIGLPQAQGNIRQKMADLQLEVSQPYIIEIFNKQEVYSAKNMGKWYKYDLFNMT